MQARAPISTFYLFSCFSVFFTRRFGLRRRGPNAHSSQNSSIFNVLVALFLIRRLGASKYTKSTVFTAPIFQNDVPACIITPSGSSRSALLALFGTLSRATKPEYVGIYRSAFAFRSSRLHNNVFWTRRFLLFRALGIFGEFREPLGSSLGTSWEPWGSSLGALGSFGQLWGAPGSSGQLWGAPAGLSEELWGALGSSGELWTALGTS